MIWIFGTLPQCCKDGQKVRSIAFPFVHDMHNVDSFCMIHSLGHASDPLDPRFEPVSSEHPFFEDERQNMQPEVCTIPHKPPRNFMDVGGIPRPKLDAFDPGLQLWCEAQPPLDELLRALKAKLCFWQSDWIRLRIDLFANTKKPKRAALLAWRKDEFVYVETDLGRESEERRGTGTENDGWRLEEAKRSRAQAIVKTDRLSDLMHGGLQDS